MSLSIVCITTGLPRAEPFILEMGRLAQTLGAELVLGAHGDRAVEFLHGRPNVVPVEGAYLEQMLDSVFVTCKGDWILRLDDDERCSGCMTEWLRTVQYRSFDNWAFPRVHLWPHAYSMIADAPFFPDFQGRLSTKAKASRPPLLHVGPYGPVHFAKVAIEHHNFIVKTIAERDATTDNYDRLAGRPVAVRARRTEEHSFDRFTLRPYDGHGSGLNT